jgi:hypothetical protein
MTPYPAAPAVPAWQGAGARPAPAFPNVAALFDKGRVVVVQATSAARHHWTDTLRIALSDDNGLQTVFVTLDPGEMRAMQGGVPKILDAVRKAGNFFKGMIFAVDSRQHASGVVIRQLDALATTSVLGGAPPLVLDASYNGALRRDVFCHNGTYEGDAAGLGAKQLWQVVKGPLVRSAFEVGDHAPAVLATAAGAMIDKTAG